MSANEEGSTGTVLYWKRSDDTLSRTRMDTEKNGDDMILRVTTGDDGIIHIRMQGNLSEDHLMEVSEWADMVRSAMKLAFERNPHRVLTLIDVTGAFEADAKTMEVLRSLMLHNKDYATRTAVFGATYFIRMIVEAAIRATLRSNMAIFMTRDEALGWLLRDEGGTDRD